MGRRAQATRRRYRRGLGIAVQRAIRRARRRRAADHVLPDFLIIGTEKGGTTSLFRYLAQHPAVVEPDAKELHHFEPRRPLPLWEYRLRFPSATEMRSRSSPTQPAITGEATPNYLFLPYVPARVRAALGDVPLVVLLRDPVERAWSQWRMEVALGTEELDFADALDAEEARIAWARRRHDHRELLRVAYRSKGEYVDQLRRWYAEVPADRLLVLRSEDLFTDPASALGEVLRFLGLPPVGGVELGVHRPFAGGRAEDHPLDPAVRSSLAAYFAERNRDLAEVVGRDIGWSRAGPSR